MFSLYLPTSATNTSIEIVKRDDHEFAIFAEFIFTCDMNIYAINIYLIICQIYLIDISSTIDTSSLILLKQFLMVK